MKRLKLSISLLALALLAGCTNSTNVQTPTQESISEVKKETYILVHAAWLGAWEWGSVAENLREKGHAVIAPDLPGHGKDKTSPADITMDDYVSTLLDIIDKQEESVILVGHSFNGITVTEYGIFIFTTSTYRMQFGYLVAKWY